MSAFNNMTNPPRAMLWIDNRFHIVIRRNDPPPMHTAQLTVLIYPITDGQIWDEPYDVFFVDEGSIVELEQQMKE